MFPEIFFCVLGYKVDRGEAGLIPEKPGACREGVLCKTMLEIMVVLIAMKLKFYLDHICIRVAIVTRGGTVFTPSDHILQLC